jgi:hypothetical protein
MASYTCGHFGRIQSVVPLRTRQACGATLCCDNSPNRQASRHAMPIGHSVIASRTRRAVVVLFPEDAFVEY